MNKVKTTAADDELCEDCPPIGYPTEKTRCLPCPRRGMVAKIAEGLTVAQRKVALRGNTWSGRGMWPLINGLAAKGLLKDGWGSERSLSPLGQAVAAHLRTIERDGEGEGA